MDTKYKEVNADFMVCFNVCQEAVFRYIIERQNGGKYE